jgi:thiol peroxidase
MPRTVSMKGKPLNLVGNEPQIGQKAPDFSLSDNTLSPVKLVDSAGKPRLLSVVPSLDTAVCSLQTRTFNDRLSELGDSFQAYTISADLPFAQKRFCDENAIRATQTLSDHRDMSFGKAYGLMIENLRLLARAVLVVDKNDTITYVEIVPEITQEPDYAKALAALKKAIG